MPPTPSASQVPAASLDYDDHPFDPSSSSSSSSPPPPPPPPPPHSLSFPSLNDLRTLTSSSSTATSPSPPSSSPSSSPDPSQSFTPLTLKSVRAAKTRNKLRQESQIDPITGLRRNSLPKSALSQSYDGSSFHHPPLPVPSSSTSSSTDNPSMALLSNSERSLSADLSSSTWRRESSSSASGQNIQVMPRPILKDTSARDKLRESWMSEPPGFTAGSHARPASAMPISPIAPPKSLARTNSSKRQSKLSRLSGQDYDQDALTPRPRPGSTGYGPDYKPRRQSGGPGHLLYSIEASSSGADFESEEYDDSDMEDAQQHSKYLQEQYSLLQKSTLVTAGSEELLAVDDVPYFAKRGQRKSLGDELNLPPVPEKSSQRKRVSTMGAATLPSVPPSLAAAYMQKTKDRRPFGSVGSNSLSFEPLFALKEGTQHDALLSGETEESRLSAVSDGEWQAPQNAEQPIHHHGVSVLDLSKRELTEIPANLSSTLTHLRLAHNMISVYTPVDSLTNLSHLQVLDLCDNQLEILPPEIGLLSKLKELYLSNNKLWKLPDNIQKMARLEVLDVRNNQFYLLNPAVGKLKGLRQLDVRHNRLKSLPAPLSLLSSTLTVLLVDGNPFVQPFSELLQPLMIEDKESGSGRQSFLSDDPYGEPANRNSGSITAKITSTYEPWRRSPTPGAARRPSTLAKRRSHSDLMSIVGLKKDDTDEGPSAADQTQKASTISTMSGAYIASALNSESNSRRIRSVSTSVSQEGEGPPSSSSSTPLSLNKFLKSIRKGSSKASLKDIQAAAAAAAKQENQSKRYSMGSEGDVLVDIDSDTPEPETKPSSKGSTSSKRSGINQWVRGRFHRRSNSNELATTPDRQNSEGSLGMYTLEGNETHPVRDSGYGGTGTSTGPSSSPSVGSTPDLSLTLSQGKGTGVLESRFLNKSTGHLPYGSLTSTRDLHPSASVKDTRYSYASIESQMTQATEGESEGADVESVGGQQHRLSSVHSPTTPLPSSPVVNGTIIGGHGASSWNAGNPLYGQSAAYIRPFMQYLKDLHDLDPDSSEWEEVYAWRRVWNAERSTAIGIDSNRTDRDTDDATNAEKQAKDEEIRIAKLQAQASRRRRILDEILTTERTYVEGLKGLVEIYLTPALQVMPAGDHKAVFSNAQAIYTFHANHFLPELEKAYHTAFIEPAQKSVTPAQNALSPTSPLPTVSSFASAGASAPSSEAPSSATQEDQKDAGEAQASDASAADGSQNDAVESSDKPSAAGEDTDAKEETPVPTPAGPSAEELIKMAVADRIGRVFAEHVPYMKMYSFYINNYDNALRVLQTQLTQAKHKKKMKEFLRRCAKHPNHNQLALQGYLLLPVQRIPRYKMLLHDLLENTWSDHVDYQDISTALDKISSRADEMNERKRQYENHEKVLLIQNRIIGQYKTPLVQPHRKVVREGMLHLIRVVTRNVSMGVEKTVPATGPSVGQVGDLTVHHLSEETVERSFLFILFNDIMIQCNPVTVSGKSSSGANSSGTGSSIGSSVSSIAGGVGSGSGADVKNLELCRVLQLESRLHPAEVIGQDVLRVVDDAMIMYLTGDKEVIQSWKDDINSRW